jgi:hypothetical protein
MEKLVVLTVIAAFAAFAATYVFSILSGRA